MLRDHARELGRKFPILTKMYDAFQHESGQVISGDMPLIQIENRLTTVGRLHFPSSLRGNSPYSWAVRGVFEELRAYTRRKLGDVTGAERIYVARFDAGTRRHIVNESDLATALEAKGFQIVVPGQSQDYLTEMATFMNAKLIVGLTGAGLTNLAFAPSGSNVVELIPDNYRNDCYMLLCNILGINYAVDVLYDMVAEDPDPHQCEWRIDVDAFVAYLSALNLI